MDLLKKFNDYFKLIGEALNNPIDVNWKENNDNKFIGYFELNEIIYKIESIKQIGNNWSFSFFYLNDGIWETKLRNDGKNTFRVLSTIKKSIYDLYNIKKPNSIVFSSIDNNSTRKRIYLTFCEEFCENKNWKLSNQGSNNLQLYLLFNNNISDFEKNEMFDSVKKIIEEGK